MAMVMLVLLAFGGGGERGIKRPSYNRPGKKKKVRTGTALHFCFIIENYHNI
jgi:hypothetical protein